MTSGDNITLKIGNNPQFPFYSCVDTSVIPGHLGNGCHPLLLVLQQCLIKVFKLLGRKYPDMMVCINCIGEKSTKSIIV